MPLEVETASPWWGCLCACSLASQKPSEREFFVPARTDLGVKLLKKVFCETEWFLNNEFVLLNESR